MIPSFGELSPAECEGVLQRNNVGRLAFSLHDRVNVVPVHYVYSGGWLYGRTGPRGKLLQILRNRWVAFEVDQHDGLFDWQSVIVHGALYLIEPQRSPHDRAVYDRALEVLRDLIPETLEIGDPVPFRNRLFRIHVAEISGRFSVSQGGDAVAPTEGVVEFDSADASADESLQEKVLKATAPFIRAPGVAMHVEVQDGVVVLGGTVADSRARSAIEASVVQIPGVHALVQQLEAGGLRSAELGPREIAASAIRALNSSPLPAGSNVTIVVDHGWLRIEGSISSPKARDEIRRRVENIPGTRGFVDRMIVAPAPTPAGQRSESSRASATL